MPLALGSQDESSLSLQSNAIQQFDNANHDYNRVVEQYSDALERYNNVAQQYDSATQQYNNTTQQYKKATRHYDNTIQKYETAAHNYGDTTAYRNITSLHGNANQQYQKSSQENVDTSQQYGNTAQVYSQHGDTAQQYNNTSQQYAHQHYGNVPQQYSYPTQQYQSIAPQQNANTTQETISKAHEDLKLRKWGRGYLVSGSELVENSTVKSDVSQGAKSMSKQSSLPESASTDEGLLLPMPSKRLKKVGKWKSVNLLSGDAGTVPIPEAVSMVRSIY